MTASAPPDFRERLRTALHASDAHEAWGMLQRLCSENLEYVQVLQLGKALDRVAAEKGAPDLPSLRLAMLSSSTIDHLLPAIRVCALGRGIWLELFMGGYGTYRQDLLVPSPALEAFEPDCILLSVSARETLDSISVASNEAEVRTRTESVVGELRNLWRLSRERFGAFVIQQSFLDVSIPLFGNFDRLVASSSGRVVYELNHLLLDAVNEENVLLLDVAAASSRDGIGRWFDLTRWLQGKLEISPEVAPTYGDMVARVVAAQKGLSLKCLVLDLDNTLWGGVIGDDGLDGIILGEGNATGEAFLHVQRYAKRLKERGVVLAVCSKNEASVAEVVFREHPEMVLRMDDIAVFVANWNDKATNLTEIASHLNIGVDSLVFVDDNPVERARVREALPAVAVPDLPEDPAGYVDCIVAGGYFEAASYTQEDRDRAREYAANSERVELQSSAQSMEDFLLGLEMKMKFGKAGDVEMPRVLQLLNKTNQFNTTTRRYTSEELARMKEDAGSDVLFFRLRDRFGDSGLVSVVLLSSSADGKTLELDNWVMSCRVFGRQFEDAIMNEIVARAVGRDIEEIRAKFIPTPKNAVIGGLFENFGFDMTSTDADHSCWMLRLADYKPRETRIDREG